MYHARARSNLPCSRYTNDSETMHNSWQNSVAFAQQNLTEDGCCGGLSVVYVYDGSTPIGALPTDVGGT